MFMDNNTIDIGSYNEWNQISVTRFHIDMAPKDLNLGIFRELFGDGRVEFYSNASGGYIIMSVDSGKLAIKYKTGYVSDQAAEKGREIVVKKAHEYFDTW